MTGFYQARLLLVIKAWLVISCSSTVNCTNAPLLSQQHALEEEKVCIKSPRYGTWAPCDDPSPCEVGPRTGFLVATTLGESRLPNAGLGRFSSEAIGAGSLIRLQEVDSENLLSFDRAEDLLERFPLPEDIPMLSDFAFSTSTLESLVLLDSPPTYVNHASSASGANTSFKFIGKVRFRVCVCAETCVFFFKAQF